MVRMAVNSAKVAKVRDRNEIAGSRRRYLFREPAYQGAPTMLRALLSVPCALLASALLSQSGIRITEPGALVLRPDLDTDAAALAGMKAAGIAPESMADIGRGSEIAHWPEGLRTDSARAANKAALRNYAAYLVCEYATDEGAMTIVSVPAAFNFHMPDALRAKEDFYLVFRAGGVEAVDPATLREPPSKGPAWQRLRPARIMRPDGVYATYNLADDAEGLAALEKQGLSKAEVEAVVFRSHERNWPSGIDSFEKRYPRLKDFKKYKAFRLAKWGDKVLLAIPNEANRKAPEGIRPLIDVYMVFLADAVQVKEKK